MDRVWIPRESGHSFKEADVWGATKIIVPNEISPFQLDRVKEYMVQAVKECSIGDRVIACGPPHYMALLTAMWPHPVMHVLIFHAKNRNYLVREIELPCHSQAKA